MSDTPKFTVVDRRKFRAEEESVPSKEMGASANSSAGPVDKLEPVEKPGPRLALVEPAGQSGEGAGFYEKASGAPVAVADLPLGTFQHPGGGDATGLGSGGFDAGGLDAARFEDTEEIGEDGEMLDGSMHPAPTDEESRFQKMVYLKAAERLEDLVRAQNPGAPAPEKIGFAHLVQQLYLSAMMQMGAGTPEGQRPRIDILGARQTIDLLEVVLDKSKGNLSMDEERTLGTVLYELRMTFLELTRMITAPQPPMSPPPGAKR